MARNSTEGGFLPGFRVVASVGAKPDQVHGAEVRERLICRTTVRSGYGGCHFFLNHHRPNAVPLVPAVRCNSHHASAA